MLFDVAVHRQSIKRPGMGSIVGFWVFHSCFMHSCKSSLFAPLSTHSCISFRLLTLPLIIMTSIESKPRILFLCPHNSCRSQMAEALCRKIYGNKVIVESAGCNPSTAVNPAVIAVMAEEGIDLSCSRPKSMRDLYGVTDDQITIDYVIVMFANYSQPLPPVGRNVGQYVYHIFDEPTLVVPEGTDGLGAYRRLRNQIEHYLQHHAPFCKVLHEDLEENMSPCMSRKV